MNDLRKAAEMALDALMQKGEHHPKVYQAAEALRQALAQPEQEPVGYVTDSGKSAYILLGVDLEDDTPLYVAPPKDDWVGLTDEEKQGVLEDATGDGGHVYYDTLFQSYEAKLKEKNG